MIVFFYFFIVNTTSEPGTDEVKMKQMNSKSMYIKVHIYHITYARDMEGPKPKITRGISGLIICPLARSGLIICPLARYAP